MVSSNQLLSNLCAISKVFLLSANLAVMLSSVVFAQGSGEAGGNGDANWRRNYEEKVEARIKIAGSTLEIRFLACNSCEDCNWTSRDGARRSNYYESSMLVKQVPWEQYDLSLATRTTRVTRERHVGGHGEGPGWVDDGETTNVDNWAGAIRAVVLSSHVVVRLYSERSYEGSVITLDTPGCYSIDMPVISIRVSHN